MNESKEKLKIWNKNLSKDMFTSQNYTEIEISYCSNVESILEEIFTIRSLTKLIIQDCHVISIPSSISNLLNLKILDLSSNEIQILPDSICELIQLEHLILKLNRLIDLPKNLSHLINLTILRLDHNQLTELPADLDSLQKLDTLFLSENCLSSIPQFIGFLVNLQLFSIIPQEPPLDPVIFYCQDARIPQHFITLKEMLNRFYEFLPYISEKIRNNLPLTEWDLHFPLYAKYIDLLTQLCDQYPTETAKSIIKILETTGLVKQRKKMKILI